MDILTPEEKQKEKKLYKTLYIILIILPLIGLLTIWTYFSAQKSLLNDINGLIKSGQIEEAKELAAQLEDLELLDENNETLLMVACEMGSSEMIEWALAHNADPNYSPRGATTPLELYCSFGFRGGPETLMRLLKAGAQVQSYRYNPPIFCLAEKLIWMTPSERDVALEEMLILYHSGDKIRHNGTTLFHYAAQYDNEELATALLSTAAGAKQLAEKNQDGKTPYDLALEYGSAKIQRLVRRFQEGLLEILDEPTQPEYEQEIVDNKDELDALINSLYEQSTQSQNATEPVESEPATEPEE